MKYQAIVSDRAAQMLERHIRFLAQVSKDAARRTKNEIMSEIRALEQMPLRWSFFDEPYIPACKYHKLPVAGRYLVLYQVRDNQVEVDYILDCREDYCWLIN